MGTNLFLLASVALALVWNCGEPSDQPLRALYRIAMFTRSLNKMLPAVFAWYAARSCHDLFAAVFSFDLQFPLDDGVPTWVGTMPLQIIALQVSLAVWRAEKVESLLLRVRRSADSIHSEGIEQSLASARFDALPAIWGSGRRIALVVMSSLGCVSFAQVALPAVVIDEFLSDFMGKAQDHISRKFMPLPSWFEILIMPIADLSHFVPAVCKVVFLAAVVCPTHEHYSLVLTLAAAAAAVHNCYTVYYTLVDIPDTLRQLLRSR